MTGIEVAVTHPMVMFFYFVLWAPRITVDGVEHKARWHATTVVPAAPGVHTVDVHYRIYWYFPGGRATTTVTVPEDGTARLRYRSPFFFAIGKGSLSPA